jgi:hypothetical protein
VVEPLIFRTRTREMQSYARYGRNPTDPQPATFVILKLEAALDGKPVKDFVPLEIAANACKDLEQYLVPSDADFSKDSPPRLKAGTYVIKVHYRLDGREYDAAFELAYSHGVGFARWGIIC